MQNSFNSSNNNGTSKSNVDDDDDEDVEEDEDDRSIKVPLYYDERREKIAVVLKMPIQGEKNKWIQLMPALFVE